MTPAKEFLYFLVTILLFSTFLFIWETDSSSPVSTPMPAEQVQPTREFDGQIADSLKIEETESDVDSVLVVTVSDEIEEENIPLFQPTSLIFAADDSIRFKLLWQKLTSDRRSELPVRIVYFGDSQIENDRITSALRESLQEKYGGKGAGFIPIDEYYNTYHQLLMEISKNWDLRTFQDKNWKPESLLFRNAILTDHEPEGWFRIRRIKRLNPQPDYQLMKLYYMSKDTCHVTVTQGRRVIYSGTLQPQEQVATLDFQFNQTPNDIRFDFVAADTLNIAGLSLESGGGALVDNVALRGLSYPPFETSDRESIEQMLEQVDVGLFVLHFGVNLVPYNSDNDYLHFRIHLQRQISFLKQIRPDVPILIIGVSDMAQKENGQFTSYSTIQAIKQIQLEMALKNHAAFWDLQAFMGGAGAMQRWVEASPALGRKDYIHFSRRGAEIVGAELGKTILSELSVYSDSI